MSRTIGQLKKNKKTKKQQQTDFIKWFCEYASISRACKKAKVPRSTVYEWLKSDRDFKKKYDESIDIAVSALEDEAIRRAHEGTIKPVFQGGKQVGKVREYSDTLLIFLLKGLAPEKYKDRAKFQLGGDPNDLTPIPVETKFDLAKLTTEELEQIASLSKKAVK